MSVDLRKLEAGAPQLVSLAKKVEKVSLDKGLDPSTNRAAVVAIFDSSPSNEMGRNHNYSSGLMGRTGDLVLAAGFTFDDDMRVPVGYFNSRAYSHGDIEPEQAQGLIDRTYRQYWGGGTNYLAALQWIVSQVEEFASVDLGRPGDPLTVKFQSPLPVFAIFVTDGEPLDDHNAIKEYLRRISQLPIFVQFVGVGADNDFAFLKSLDGLKGRLIDNAGFFNAMDAVAKKRKLFGGGQTDPAEEQQAVLEGLLNEFPTYYRRAREIGILV